MFFPFKVVVLVLILFWNALTTRCAFPSGFIAAALYFCNEGEIVCETTISDGSIYRLIS